MPTRAGTVLVERLTLHGMDGWIARAIASFEDAPREQDGSADCETTEVGSCVLETCTAGSAEPPSPVGYVSAGTLRVSGEPEDLLLTPGDDGTYGEDFDAPDGLFGADEPWATGAPITITASGAVVPELTTTATAPSHFEPDDSLLALRTVSRDEDQTFSWTPGGGDGSIEVSLEVLTPGEGIYYRAVRCTAPVDDGRLVAPRELLEALPVGSTATLRAVSLSEPQTVRASDWLVTVNAADLAITDSVAIE